MYQRKGFTLIELLVVIAIIGVLAAAGFASYIVVLRNARDAKRQSDLKLVQSGLENYFADQKRYPTKYPDSASGSCINGFLKGGCPLKSPDGLKVYLNDVPKDPATSNPYLYKAWKSNGTSECANTDNDCIKYCIYAKGENIPNRIDVSFCTDDPDYNIEVTTP